LKLDRQKRGEPGARLRCAIYGKNNCASTISTGNQISDMTPTYAGHGMHRPVDCLAVA